MDSGAERFECKEVAVMGEPAKKLPSEDAVRWAIFYEQLAKQFADCDQKYYLKKAKQFWREAKKCLRRERRKNKSE